MGAGHPVRPLDRRRLEPARADRAARVPQPRRLVRRGPVRGARRVRGRRRAVRAKFLEGLASADVIPDEPAQRRIVAAVNPHLRPAGAELRETGTDGGYPVFSVVSTRAARARQPKNLIFASPVKPDIRITDAIDNDIEIVANADKVLVYDRPIGPGGVRWRDLQAWWKDDAADRRR